MAEKRLVRNDDGAPPTPTFNDPREGNSDPTLDRLPGNVDPLPGIKEDPGNELLELAERQVAEARERLGPQTAKPRLDRIKALFDNEAGRAPDVSKELAQAMHGLALAGQVAAFDGTYDHALAVAYNQFDKASVQVGSVVQIAYDDWAMAVRVYQSEQRAAGAILTAANEATRHPPATSRYDQPIRGETHVDYYVKSEKVATALLTYERRMQTAGAALAEAYGTLISALYGAIGTLGVAESTLILVLQSSSKAFWTSVQNAIAQIRD